MKSIVNPLAVALLFGASHCSFATTTEPLTDTTPPSITGISFTPNPADATESSVDITVTIHVTDDLSGVAYGNCWFYAPNYAQYIYAYFWLSGDPLDGELSTTITIPRYAANGTWFFDGLQIFDAVGNYTSLSSSDVEQFLGLPAIFEVISDPDLTPPTVVGIAIDPSVVDTSTDSQNVTVTFHITDDVSGVYPEGFEVWLTQYQRADGSYNYHYLTDLSQIEDPDGNYGTPNDSYWQGNIFLPRYSAEGTWSLQFNIRDSAGNRAYGPLEPDPGSIEPYDTEITVISNPGDALGAIITSLSVTPVSIDTSLEARDVTMNLHVEDNLSGVANAWVRLRSPSGGQYRWFYFSTFDGTEGYPLSANLSSTSQFPQYSEGGTWRILDIWTLDAAQNWRYWPEANLPSGIQVALNVIFSTLDSDGTIDPGETTPITITDQGDGITQITIPGEIITQPTTVAIDVLSDPLDVPLPTGFSGTDTLYVNFHLDPEPAFPLDPPGITVTLPLARQLAPGRSLFLFRINELTGLLEPSLSVYGGQVVGTVNADGQSATFAGISRLSTVVALLQDPVITWNDPANIIYGTELSGVQLNATATLDGAPIAGTFSYTPGPGTLLGAGDGQALNVVFVPDNQDYRTVEKTVSINVHKKDLLIKADAKSMTEGEVVPDLTASYLGFIAGESPDNLNPKPSLSTAATSLSGPGDYDILVGGAGSPNYDITYSKGILTISPAAKASLQMAGYTLASSKRLSLKVWEYTYTVKMKNIGSGIGKSVSATLTSNKPYVTVVGSGTVNLSDIPAGQERAGQNTYTIRVDRTFQLVAGDLSWNVNYTESSGASKSATLPY